MSERHYPGEKVTLRANAGFAGNPEPVNAIIVSNEHETPSRCPLCADSQCREWPTLLLLDANGKRTMTVVNHVSECEMSRII
jgi:hypothetical protein